MRWGGKETGVSLLLWRVLVLGGVRRGARLVKESVPGMCQGGCAHWAFPRLALWKPGSDKVTSARFWRASGGGGWGRFGRMRGRGSPSVHPCFLQVPGRPLRASMSPRLQRRGPSLLLSTLHRQSFSSQPLLPLMVMVWALGVRTAAFLGFPGSGAQPNGREAN